MRKALAYRPPARTVAVVVTLLAFVVWGALRAVPFLQHSKPAEIYATPTTQPIDGGMLAPVLVPGKGGRACVTNIAYGPGAKYVYITLQSVKYPAGALTIEARAPGYSASVEQAAGLQGSVPVIVKIAPAPREVGGGTLCVRNHGRHRIGLYGIPPGRGSAPATTTVDGKPVGQQLSVTLLTSPSASLGSRLGTIFDHAAAFRPVTGWEIWVLALLVGIGAPIALALALARAVAEDELPPPE